jgi:hypothetical protein
VIEKIGGYFKNESNVIRVGKEVIAILSND